MPKTRHSPVLVPLWTLQSVALVAVFPLTCIALVNTGGELYGPYYQGQIEIPMTRLL